MRRRQMRTQRLKDRFKKEQRTGSEREWGESGKWREKWRVEKLQRCSVSSRAPKGKESKAEERGEEKGTVAYISRWTADYRALKHRAEAQLSTSLLHSKETPLVWNQMRACCRIKKKYNRCNICNINYPVVWILYPDAFCLLKFKYIM